MLLNSMTCFLRLLFCLVLVCLTNYDQTLETLLDCRLVEIHIFSFVVGRAFVTDIEKLKISSKMRSLNVVKVLRFFSEVTKVCPLHLKLMFFSVSLLLFLNYLLSEAV